jgi:hypothetical protein
VTVSQCGDLSYDRRRGRFDTANYAPESASGQLLSVRRGRRRVQVCKSVPKPCWQESQRRARNEFHDSIRLFEMVRAEPAVAPRASITLCTPGAATGVSAGAHVLLSRHAQR